MHVFGSLQHRAKLLYRVNISEENNIAASEKKKKKNEIIVSDVRTLTVIVWLQLSRNS